MRAGQALVVADPVHACLLLVRFDKLSANPRRGI
jgi:hypothetical protein